MLSKILLISVPLLVFVVFSLTVENSFGETRTECRNSVGKDLSLTPVERVYALQACSELENKEPTFAKFYSEELHKACHRRVAQDNSNNHALRMGDLKMCNKLQKPDITLAQQKITKFSKVMIDFCGEKYGVFQLVGPKKMVNHAGIATGICLDLYSTPIWNSTAKDRNIQLHNFLINKTEQSLAKFEDTREKIVEESRLNRPIITTLIDLFYEQKEKIEYLENQLKEKNEMPNYFQQDFFSEELENCSRIYYDEELLLDEKINALNDCSGMPDEIKINHAKVAEHSKNTVQFCEETFAHFSKLGRQAYYNNYLKNIETETCVFLYAEPIWEYNEYDRTQVLETFLHYKIVKRIFEDARERDYSSEMAIADSRWQPILTDIYNYQKQKIEFLENLLKNN